MCVYSMMAQDRINKWQKNWWDEKTSPFDEMIYIPPPIEVPPPRELEKEIEELKRLLKLALEYDIKNNEPACESETKKKILIEMAKKLGVEIELP